MEDGDNLSEPPPDSAGTCNGGVVLALAPSPPSPGGASGREDPVWKTFDLTARLAFMESPPPGNAPPNVNLQLGAPDEFLQALRKHAIEHIDAELLCDRRDIWDGEPVDGQVPEWMYLRGKSLESHTHFHHWCRVVKEDLECDDRACQSFIKLFNMNPPEAPQGYMEACRVLAHIFKDKCKDADEVIAEHRGWSRYLQRACEEAFEALEHWQNVKDLKLTASSWSDWNAYTPAPPAAAGPGGGKGPGKGKGNVLLQGPR